MKQIDGVNRIYNFGAGPCTLPLSALKTAQAEMLEFKGSGMSLIEASHRGKDYDDVHQAAVSLFKENFGLGDNHTVLLLGGGATLQFGMLPMNYLWANKNCDYVVSGAWGKKALADAKKLGTPKVIWDGSSSNFTTLPKAADLKPSADAAYVHFTSNETIGGVQWKEWPDTGDVPLVCDMSSDILSRPVPLDRFSLIYAGAQKNLAPAGLTVVIIRKDFLEKAVDPKNVITYLSYKVHAEENSLYNTPPVFPIYMMKLTMEWVKANGGLKGMQKLSEARGKVLYDAINGSGGYYRCPVDASCRSDMNVVWRLPTEELEAQFISEAKKAGFVGLKGHRSVGGCRASIYNAMPVDGCTDLASFMADFAKKNG